MSNNFCQNYATFLFKYSDKLLKLTYLEEQSVSEFNVYIKWIILYLFKKNKLKLKRIIYLNYNFRS